MSFFDELVAFRLQKAALKDISKIIKKDRGNKYDSESHFFRVAVLKHIREEKMRLRI